MVLPMVVTFGLIGLGSIVLIGGGFWIERLAAAQQQREAEHPYAEVEPPTSPTRFRFVTREQITASMAERLDRLHNNVFKRAPAPDFDPAVGDLVVALAELDERNDNGSAKTECFVCRVLWPRDSYVRAKVYAPPGYSDLHGLGEGAVIDIPREALATVSHWTGPPSLTEPALGTS